MNAKSEPSQELAKIIASAKRLGVELNESDALQWLAQAAVYVTATFTVVSGLHYAFATAERIRNMERTP